MAKPPVRRVMSDDCEVEIDGESYRLHEGEWVELIGASTVKELQALWKFGRVDDEEPSEDASESDKQAYRDHHTSAISASFDDLCEAIGMRVVTWNWTDEASRPLPLPNGTAGPMRNLHPEELYWLRSAIRGETNGSRKNGSTPSEKTSSARAGKVTSKR